MFERSTELRPLVLSCFNVYISHLEISQRLCPLTTTLEGVRGLQGDQAGCEDRNLQLDRCPRVAAGVPESVRKSREL